MFRNFIAFECYQEVRNATAESEHRSWTFKHSSHSTKSEYCSFPGNIVETDFQLWKATANHRTETLYITHNYSLPPEFKSFCFCWDVSVTNCMKNNNFFHVLCKEKFCLFVKFNFYLNIFFFNNFNKKKVGHPKAMPQQCCGIKKNPSFKLRGWQSWAHATHHLWVTWDALTLPSLWALNWKVYQSNIALFPMCNHQLRWKSNKGCWKQERFGKYEIFGNIWRKGHWGKIK